MIVLNALSQPLSTLTSSQVLKEPNLWRCSGRCCCHSTRQTRELLARDNEQLDELFGSVMISRWQRQNLIRSCSMKDGGTPRPGGAALLQRGVFQQGQPMPGCLSNPKRMERPWMRMSRGCAWGLVERVKSRDEPELCSVKRGLRKESEECQLPLYS